MCLVSTTNTPKADVKKSSDSNVRFCLGLKEPDRNPKVIIDRTLAASATSSDQGAKLRI
jgi:hypothetical protein